MLQNSLITLILGGLPLIEARYSLVIGSQLLEVLLPVAVTAAFIGNILAIFALNTLLYKFFPKKENFFKRLITKLINMIKHKQAHKINGLAFFTLILFVAIPLPISGSYSGTVIGYLAGLSYKENILANIIGTALSITIMILTLGSLDISSKFFVKLFS